MADGHGFNEVFFEDVRVPKSNVVGDVNRGWYHLAVALDFERSGIGAFAGGRRTVEEIAEFAAAQPRFLQQRPHLRYELAERMIEVEVGTYMAYRIVHLQSQGVVANHEASMAKLFGSELGQRIARTGVELLGLHGGLWGQRRQVRRPAGPPRPRLRQLRQRHHRRRHQRNPAQHHRHPRPRPPPRLAPPRNRRAQPGAAAARRPLRRFSPLPRKTARRRARPAPAV